jgi:hypothetical protein
LILPPPPELPQIKGYKTLKNGEVWKCPPGGGVCFDSIAWDTLKYREDLRNYYIKELKAAIDDYNKILDEYYNRGKKK